MSRIGSTFSKHRKDNYSLDIKNIYKTGIIQTPFAKKREGEDRFFTRLKTQMVHNTSHQQSSKQISRKQSRRLSLTKTFKMNNSVGVENHLAQQKFKRVKQFIAEGKYQECISIIRQLLMRQDNQFVKNKLYWLNAKCFQKVGKIKEAQNFLTRLLNEEPDKYEALIERAKVRFALGAKQLSIRDIKHAIYVDQKNQQGYKQLCNIYLVEGEQKEAYHIASLALQKGIDSVEMLITIVQLLLTNPSISLSSQQKVRNLVQKLQDRLGNQSKDSADLLYLQAILLETKMRLNEACIYYEQCLKFNNSKFSVTRSLQRLILIKIDQRDYYSAYHTVNRYNILNIQNNRIYPYIIFLEGVILIMKKKYIDGIKLFDTLIQIMESNQVSSRSQLFLSSQIKSQSKNSQSDFQMGQIHHNCKSVVIPLLYKFNAYASFKMGRHERSISYYEKLSNWGLDQCSSYNLLLAEGIVAVEKKKNFQLGMQKFEQARYVYPCKVQPSLYIAMAIIYRDLCLSGIINNQQNQSETLTSAVIHAMEELNEAHQTVNDSSSNLLYHRCILNFYMEEWEAAQADINLCIEKAEENEPKYFYLRGLSYAVVKDLRRAINEYSISLSLDPQYQLSLLERSKCYFLLGETQVGFSDLKQYMYKNPTKYQVHKWIGDLLYEGRSYSDALKAYQQIQESIMFENEVMKCKCMARISDLHKLSDSLTKMSKLEECDESKIQVDILAVSVLRLLSKNHQSKQLAGKIKKLNNYLEQNCVGYVFGLIDCMNLLGVATFDIGRYEQAYQSFLLSLQLFTTLAQKNKTDLKSDCSQEGLSLSIQDIYLNIIYSLLGMKDSQSAAKIMSNELLAHTMSQSNIKTIGKVLQKYELEDKCHQTFILEADSSKNSKIKFKQVQIRMKSLKIKCNPTFSLFHKSADDLYSKSVAQKIVRDLRPSYIDNMPQGPWIKRNEHGVIFTDNMIEVQGSSVFLSSMRAKQSEEESHQNTVRQEYDEGIDIRKRQQFKRKMQLDKQLQKKLNSIIQKTQRSDECK